MQNLPIDEMDKTEAIRLHQMETFIPTIWRNNTYLYVGANPNRFHFWMALANLWDLRGVRIDLLEIVGDNIKELRKKFRFIAEAYKGDVSDDIVRAMLRVPYDVAIWSHGPAIFETVKRIEVALYNLESRCKCLVVMTPWGEYPYPNGAETLVDEFNRNVTPLYPDFFIERGYAVHTIGQPNTRGSNLMAWKYPGAQPPGWRKMQVPDELARRIMERTPTLSPDGKRVTRT